MAKLRMMVCPHDTAKSPEKWYLFAQHLSQRLGAEVGFDQAMDFADFHRRLSDTDLAYANPKDTVRLAAESGYQPVARPEGRYDEVVFFAHPDVEAPGFASLSGERVATVESMLPTNIALHILARENIQPAELLNRDSWLSVINAVRKQETRFGFLYKDTYDDLTGLAKGMINAFAVSEERLAFHSIVVAPGATEHRKALGQALLAMGAEAKGREILDKLGFPAWLAVSPDEFQGLQRLVAQA